MTKTNQDCRRRLTLWKRALGGNVTFMDNPNEILPFLATPIDHLLSYLIHTDEDCTTYR